MIPVLVLAIGCTREMEKNVSYIDGAITFYATSGENKTKTILQQDGSVFWSPGDNINVFYGSRSGKFSSNNTEPSDYAEFTGLLGSFVLDGETEFFASYPYSDETTLSGNVLEIGLPAEQMAQEGTFADNLFICVAKSKNYNLYFYNVCGGVKFSLARNDIKKVVFRGNGGEPLAGRLSVEFASDGMPQVNSIHNGNDSVTLLAPDGESFKAGSFYYIVLAPQVLEHGYTMELYANELVEIFSSDSPTTVRRSTWGVLKDLASGPSVTVPEIVDLGLPSGLKWASFNLGAAKPEESGDYYAWGETEPYYSSQDLLSWKPGYEAGYAWASYKWCLGSYYTLTKYNTNSSYGNSGFTDGKTVLDPEDDAAHVNLGGNWRMPTKEEQDELRENCTWEYTQINGVDGFKVEGPNGNSIFLPCSGLLEDTSYRSSFFEPESNGYYWSSSLSAEASEDTFYSYLLQIYPSGMGCFLSGRYYGYSVRPVYDDGTVTKVVTITPTNIGPCSAEIPFSISTQDTVYEYGVIYSTNRSEPMIGNLGDGNYIAVITSEVGSSRIINELKPNTTYYARAFVILGEEHGTTVYGNTIQFTTKEISYSSDYVDIGLSVAWATCNLGSSTPSNVGGYYRWGETDLSSSSTGYIWSGPDGFTKYNATDGKVTLEASDDAASVNLGGKWRMPTNDELTELRNNCTWTPTTQNGVKGSTVTGPNGKSIFIPISVGTSGEFSAEFLSSSLSTYSNDAYRYVHALSYRYDENFVYFLRTFRNWGTPIRPVYDNRSETTIKTNTPTNIGPCSAEIPFTITSQDTVYEYGVIYSTNRSEPVMGDLGDGNYLAYFTSEVGSSRIINELKPNTAYYARAFVILGEEHGTTLYGNTIQFTTKEISYSSDYVDIGLSVAWATCNLGSSTPSNVGGYYRWGETDLSSSSTEYIWSGPDGFTKYNATDGTVTLEASDDAASVNLGGKWRMPTNDELMELRDNCTWTPATQNGVKGCSVTGPNGKSIFIPISEGTTGSYFAEFLSSSLSTYSNDAFDYVHALSYHYGDNYVHTLRTFRDWGTPIRPVYDDSETIPEISVPEQVDLGLSVKWASFNLGATRPEESGSLFAWGETNTKNRFSLDNYKWYSNTDRIYTKYNWLSEYGIVDYKYFLDAEDDAAQNHLGGGWRMPTQFEIDELISNCDISFVSDYQGTGISGCIVHSNIEGFTDNSLFIPSGEYISSSLEYSKWYIQGPYAPTGMLINENDGMVSDITVRDAGQLIRPVFGPRSSWSVIPGDLVFGEVPIGTTSVKSITVINTGDSTIEIGVDANSPFSMSEYSLTIIPGESKTIEVSFTPTEKKEYQGLTSIVTRGMGRPWINVFGTGI